MPQLQARYKHNLNLILTKITYLKGMSEMLT